MFKEKVVTSDKAFFWMFALIRKKFVRKMIVIGISLLIYKWFANELSKEMDAYHFNVFDQLVKIYFSFLILNTFIVALKKKFFRKGR